MDELVALLNKPPSTRARELEGSVKWHEYNSLAKIGRPPFSGQSNMPYQTVQLSDLMRQIEHEEFCKATVILVRVGRNWP
jgi:hypothetical protein